MAEEELIARAPQFTKLVFTSMKAAADEGANKAAPRSLSVRVRGGRRLEGMGERKLPNLQLFPERGAVPLAILSPSLPIAKSERCP